MKKVKLKQYFMTHDEIANELRVRFEVLRHFSGYQNPKPKPNNGVKK